MIIPVVGFDPSLTHWGRAKVNLDLDTGHVNSPELDVFMPTVKKTKQVRVNSTDLAKAEQLFSQAYAACKDAKAVFVELPVGSQSARAMASYGICVGVTASLRALGVPIIEVTALDSKECLTGNRKASKEEMIQAAIEQYPEANWPTLKGEVIASKAEHMADAIAAIHSGVQTDTFKQLMRLLGK